MEQFLKETLVNEFADQIRMITGSNGVYDIELSNIPFNDNIEVVMKNLDFVLSTFVKRNIDESDEMVFFVKKGGAIKGFLRYNDDTPPIVIDVEIDGTNEQLKLIDIFGTLGNLTIFNDNFEIVGTLIIAVDEEEEHQLKIEIDRYKSKGPEILEKWISEMRKRIGLN
ncbi:MAG: hypothetical protein AAGB30_11085 [Pedobacter sp.]